ncbi:MAG: glutaredoxin [Xanthomonadaceae bacterium]|nr:glutaredoxin [Xanthomonadaceae bacterium]MDE2053872.1 glutaredoxin [Xanthomonadaceae bacterium]MDE2223812.1 glutaredoxin [Xanthomonadaceae bacterium]MDE2497641.1 glutaredoxin [Xanthomonadaceae bacterium]
MRIELYFSPWCTACGSRSLRDGESGNNRWIDVTKHLEAAARLRITRLPALVIDGRVVAQGPQALARLRTLAEAGSGAA